MKSPLPTIDGISPSCLTLRQGNWRNMLEFLTEHFPHVEPEIWVYRMNKGEVVDEKGIRLNAESPYRVGARVFYYRALDHEPPIPFDEQILYRDDNLIVADKPHFLPVIPSGRFLRETLLVRLKKNLNLEDLVPIHRIDKDTAGVVIFSHNRATRGAYTSLFQRQEVEKVYEALALSLPNVRFPVIHRSLLIRGEHFFRMKETHGRPNAETSIDVLETRGNISLYRLIPLTGKKHQLRVHLAALGIPIINDSLYPNIRGRAVKDFSQPLKLLAKSVTFKDPLTGQSLNFKSSKTLFYHASR